MPQAERLLIADRLEGIDVCLLQLSPDGDVSKATKRNGSVCRLQAKLPTYDSLMEAIQANEAILEVQREQAALAALAADTLSKSRSRAEETLERLHQNPEGALRKP